MFHIIQFFIQFLGKRGRLCFLDLIEATFFLPGLSTVALLRKIKALACGPKLIVVLMNRVGLFQTHINKLRAYTI